MSSLIEGESIAELIKLLSQERPQKLVDLTGSTILAIELHQESLALGAELMKVLATIEIALRNVVVENLRAHFGVNNWLQQPPVRHQWREPETKKVIQAVDSAKRAEYSKLSQAQKHELDARAFPNGRPAHVSHLQRAKARRRMIDVSEGKVIAELTMYFWKRLYGPEYEQSLWRTTLKRTFPNKYLRRAHVAAQLEVIYQARNRLAHHEPVLHKRFHDVIEAITFFVREFVVVDREGPSPLSKLIANDLQQVVESERALSERLAAFRTIKLD